MVPKLIHQTWRDADVPERFRAFRASWTRHHPGWTCRLWTDADLRAFVAEREPAFLPVFDGYAHPICRADAGRYILLKHLGGLYVDLDFECFRPIGPLVDGAGLAVGVEPDSHAALEAPRRRGLARILCPSLIASRPGHPFWDAVIAALLASRDAADVLDATGPFLLTRAYEAFADKAAIRLLPPALVYPADKMEAGSGRLFDLGAWEARTRQAFALHHWDGSWWRKDAETVGVPQGFKATIAGPSSRLTLTSEAVPLVSCLMATRNRTRQAMLAVDCFRRQTYPNRELVIVDDSRDDALSRSLAGDPAIRILRPAGGSASLGEARNRAVAEARGPYVCQWDDDDLYDPLRIAAQMTALRSTGARACLLDRWTLWWPAERRVATSLRRDWEGSLLCERASLPPYPALARGEDTPVVARLLSEVRTVRLDAPRLYVYAVHGRNTFGTTHFEAHWAAAEARFEGERALAVERELARRLPLAAYAALHGRRDLADLTQPEGGAGRSPPGPHRSDPTALALAASFQSRLGEARALLGADRAAEAAEAFETLRRDWPERPDGLEGLAQGLDRRHDWSRAIDRWDELVVLFPDHRPGFLGRARALAELGRFAEAEQAYGAALDAPETRAAARAGLARAAAQASDWPVSLERWTAILADRPQDPDAIVGRVRALLALGRIAEATRDVTAAESVLGADDRVLLHAMLLQKRHRSDDLADLLDAAPEVTARSPSLRAARLNADKGRGRIEVLADVAAIGATSGLARTVAEAVSAAHATEDDAAAREKLRRLWREQGTAGLTPDLLSATLAAVLDIDGEAEATRLLQQVDGLALRDARSVKLRLLGMFDRLRLGLATSAADELRRVADACDRRAPLGTWREAVYGIVHRFARLEQHDAEARLDTGWRESSARDILDHILAAVEAGAGFSLIRLGDGEGNFLPYPGRHRAIAADDREATQCIWWGRPRLGADASEGLSRTLQQAVRRADIVGIPDLSRLVYSLPVPTPVDLFDSWHDFRGQLAVLHHAMTDLGSPNAGRLFDRGQRLTSCHIHADLAAFGLYEDLFARVRRVSVITCHPDLPARLEARFGVATRRLIEIPHERKAATTFGYGDRGEHWPDAFERLRRELEVEPGEVVLVAAGFLGKIYADWIKQKGGIALDVGSIVDFWCGFSTRAPHFTQRYKGSQTRREGGISGTSSVPAARLKRSPGLLASWAGQPRLPGIVLHAHMGDATGIGIGGQALAASLAAAGLDHTVLDLATPAAGPTPAGHAINIVASNPWVMEHARYRAPQGSLSAEGLSGRYNIAVWAWESADTPPPPAWAGALPFFDEIWVPSRFTADALARTMGLNPTVVPHAVDVAGAGMDRASLGLPADAFLFCYVFDGLSNVERKNPLGAVRAFLRAFPEGEADLILKARNLDRATIGAIMTEAAGRPGIHLRLGDASRAETLGLIAAADAYLSLHRAEGFGLTIAEAMALGTPVIATGYSGNLDLMDEATAYPVRYALTTTDRQSGDYPPGTTWAEPDLDHAAALVREVRDDPEAARRRGQAAAEHMRQHFSPTAVGARVRARIAEIVAESAAAAKPAVASPKGRPAVAPSVLVLTPVRDAARHLPAYREALEGLDYPKDRLSLALLEGDSGDGTPELIESWLPDLGGTLARAHLHRHSEGLAVDGHRWEAAIQFARRRALARLRNRLLQRGLRDEDWVLWVDADVVGYPPDTLLRLLDTGCDIVTPHCVTRPGGPSFDLNTFQSTVSLEAEQRHLRDGIVQPPRGVGRRYLDALRGGGIVRVDGVGGTMLLVRADLHRSGLVFPAYSHRGYIETEGLAMMARDMGIACWGMPDLEILHADE